MSWHDVSRDIAYAQPQVRYGGEWKDNRRWREKGGRKDVEGRGEKKEDG